MLNIIWDQLTRHALQHNQLNTSQYALPGITCNSAVLNKVLYCDLMFQTLSMGKMTDYDATAAFNRVLPSLSIITCKRLGLPTSSCVFMYQLLQNMEFKLVTGYGASSESFKNNKDPKQTGQGVLHGSSSAAPIYNFNSDISLAAHNKLAKGATSSIQLMEHS
jgi:hypothetical protein